MLIYKKLSILVSCLALSLNCAHWAIANEPRPANGEYRVQSVSDGDTIKVATIKGGNEITVRLACVDSEDLRYSRTPQALRARNRLRQIFDQANMRVQLTFTGQDQFGRYVADARLANRTLVQEVLVRERIARFTPRYRNYCPNSFAALQRAAGQSQR